MIKFYLNMHDFKRNDKCSFDGSEYLELNFSALFEPERIIDARCMLLDLSDPVVSGNKFLEWNSKHS